MKTTDKLKLAVSLPADWLHRAANKRPVVMNAGDTIDFINARRCGIARFGDGEIDLMLGIGIKFQKADKALAARLKEIAAQSYLPESGCLVCLPDILDKARLKAEYEEKDYKWLSRFLCFTRGYIYKRFTAEKYGDTNITRFYLEKKDKSGTAEYVSKLQTLWQGRRIVFVEGDKSRLGVGNDLFANAESVRRILCPAENAFSKYAEILKTVEELTTADDLIICALGPTATVLAYDLCRSGRQALDLGHVDVEYEWFRMGASSTVNIKGKAVAESGEAFEENADLKVQNVIAKII